MLWVLNAYSLLHAVLLITSARLGDIYGPRNVFAVGIVIFTFASALSGLAQDPGRRHRLDLLGVGLATAGLLGVIYGLIEGQRYAQFRQPFVDGFNNAAHTGFEVGAGQSGASLNLPAQVQAIAHNVFTNAFVDAMHPMLVLPIVVLVLAAMSAIFVRGHMASDVTVHEAEAAVA